MGENDKKDASSSVQEFVAKSDESFNKNVIYLAAGALGLSMAFIKEIVHPQEARFVFLLVFGWLLLTATLLLNLISYWLLSKWGYHIGIKLTYINDLKIDTEDEKRIKRENLEAIRNTVDGQNKASRNMNFTSIITLILGLIFLLSFIIPNLSTPKIPGSSTSNCCCNKK